MSQRDRDYDEILRRALHAAADSVQPANDGLGSRCLREADSAVGHLRALPWCRRWLALDSWPMAITLP